MAFRKDLEDLEGVGLFDFIFVSIFPNGLGDPISKRPLIDSRTAVSACEGMTSGLKWDSVSLTSSTLKNDTSGGGVETESTEMDFVVESLSLSPCAISEHWTPGANGMGIWLGSTSTTRTEGDAVFQESWLYTLAGDGGVKTSLTSWGVPDKVWSVGDSSVEVNL